MKDLTIHLLLLLLRLLLLMLGKLESLFQPSSQVSPFLSSILLLLFPKIFHGITLPTMNTNFILYILMIKLEKLITLEFVFCKKLLVFHNVVIPFYTGKCEIFSVSNKKIHVIL